MDKPLSDEAMTIILGLKDPEKPGMHGELKEKMPDQDPIGFIMELRDMCEEYLLKCGKNNDEKPENKDTEDKEPEEAEE